MMNNPLRVAIIICATIVTLLPALAQKEEFLEEHQKTPKRQNYMLQRACKDEILRNMENIGVTYDIEPFDPDTNRDDEMSTFIDDYGNVGGNDVILLDDSFKNRSKKRGSHKVKKLDQAIPDPPCSCQYNRIIEDLGENYYPRYIETRNCSKSLDQTCYHPYMCKEDVYNLTILRLRGQDPYDLTGIPKMLKYEWVSLKLPVSVGCVCTRDFTTRRN